MTICNLFVRKSRAQTAVCQNRTTDQNCPTHVLVNDKNATETPDSRSCLGGVDAGGGRVGVGCEPVPGGAE